MDIVTHTLSGVAIGSVLINQSQKGIYSKAAILFFGALGGGFPDLDAISMWTGFDSTFGKWLSLNLTGKEIYSAKLWYSHHAFFHSVLSALVFTILIGAIFLFIQKYVVSKNNLSVREYIRDYGFILLSFFLGYVIHLFEDMLTPSSSWGGVAFLWPSAKYIGGWGNIWWWNNYDVFLIVCSVIALNFMLALLRFKKQLKRKLAVFVLVAGIFTASFQVKNRGSNYNYSKTMRYQRLEQMSLERQKEILGEDLFYIMQKIDRLMPVYF